MSRKGYYVILRDGMLETHLVLRRTPFLRFSMEPFQGLPMNPRGIYFHNPIVRLPTLVLMCILFVGIAPCWAGPAEDYIGVQLQVVRGLGNRVESIADIADEAAKGLLAEGHVYLAGEPGMVAELLGRAGGLCGAKAIAPDQPLPKLQPTDVVLFSDYGLPGNAAKHGWKELVDSGALIVAFASSENPILQQPLPSRVRAIPVDIPSNSGLIALPSGERMIPTAPPAIAIAEWTFTAELLAACRREHRQLAVYLSIFLDEGHRRIQRTQGMLFEPDLRPEPVPRGEYAQKFLATVQTSLTAIQTEEIAAIRRAAEWLHEATTSQTALQTTSPRKIIRNFQGHLPPKEAGEPGDVGFFTAMVHSMGAEGVDWIRNHLHEGDVYLFYGYQENEDAMAEAAGALGVRTIFFTSKRPGDSVAKNPLHIDINPHWPVTDGCLELPGYDVKACPLSCILGLTCYYAICAETVQR
jgi:hypothetical protein